MQVAELIIEILISRKLMLSIALPTTTPWMRENAYKQSVFLSLRDQCEPPKRPHDTLSLDFLPDSLKQRSWEPKTEKSEHNTLLEITLYQTIKELIEAESQRLKKANITALYQTTESEKKKDWKLYNSLRGLVPDFEYW